MITNSSLTVYHMSRLDPTTHNEVWTRYNYGTPDNPTVWFFGGEGAGINKGYENANDFDCRIPYDKNLGLNIANFSKGDIVVQGTLEFDITTQEDLDGYLIYNIVSKNNNNFGNNQHIHIGGK